MESEHRELSQLTMWTLLQDPEPTQQTKKCKKVKFTLPPPPVLLETPMKATNKPKIANSSRVVPSCAAAKQASALRKGFR